MEHTTLSPPLCSKHGCEKVWGKCSNSKAGGRWRCQKCQKESCQSWDKANPEKRKANSNAWAKANPEKRKASSNAWAKANPEKGKAWREANDESLKTKAQAWRKANPEKRKANSHRHNARKIAATSPLAVVTAAVIAERFALTKGCSYCGADAKLTLDHVVALSDGGMHAPSNLVGACTSCNCSKRDSPVEAWFKAQPFFSEQRWQRIQKITGQGQLSLV